MAQRGFSYLWVLLLVALLSLGALRGAELAATASQRERETELLFVGYQFREAIGSYVRASGGNGINAYPASLDDLIEDKRFPSIRRHLRKVFVDPVTGEPEWGLLTVGGRITGVYSQATSRPLKQGGFDPEEAGFANAKQYKDWVFAYQAPGLIVPPK